MKHHEERDKELWAEWAIIRKKLDDMILLHSQRPTNFSFQIYEPVEEMIIQLCILARKIKRCGKAKSTACEDIHIMMDIELFNDMYTKIAARIKKYIRLVHNSKSKKPMDLYALLER